MHTYKVVTQILIYKYQFINYDIKEFKTTLKNFENLENIKKK